MIKDFREKIKLLYTFGPEIFSVELEAWRDKSKDYYTVFKEKIAPKIKEVYNIETQGEDNVPEDGGVIIAPNHPSPLDPLILGSCIDRKLYFMAGVDSVPGDGLFYKWYRKYFLRTGKKLGSVIVDRDNFKKEDYRKILDLMKNEAVVIFPEGGLELEKKIKEIKSGIGNFIYKLRENIPVVTVGMGMDYVHSPGSFPYPGTEAYVNIEKSVYPEELGLYKKSKKEFTGDISNVIKEKLTRAAGYK